MPLFLTAVGLTLKDMFSTFARKILIVFLILSVLALLSGILPDDPFKSVILDSTAIFQPFYAVISYFFPVPFAVSSLMFFVVWRRFIYLYQIVAQSLTESSDIIDA